MDQTIAQTFANGTIAQLAALLGLSVFFVIMGLRELKQEHPQGLVYLALALFLLLAHAFQFVHIPADGPLGNPLDGFNLWSWLVVIAAPALVALFIIRSLVSFAFSAGREGMVKLFFGLTLLCFMYMLGSDWPLDVKGILTAIWLVVLFHLELVEQTA
ncbi:hypothetical protein GF377_08325 [candidate division GN15 bacterium]|nr:hypothetical protein [candidate division GN15 bacterium]